MSRREFRRTGKLTTLLFCCCFIVMAVVLMGVGYPQSFVVGASEKANAVEEARAKLEKAIANERVNPTKEAALAAAATSAGESVISEFRLRGPNGANDCSGTATIFDDAAGPPIGSGLPPFAGTFQQQTPLSTLNRKAITGNWKPRVNDTAALDVGTVGRVTLEITRQPFICCGVVDAPVIVSGGSPTITAESFAPANNAPDPGETVTATFPLINTGPNNNQHLLVVLLNSGGVTPVTTTQNYGVIVAGGPAVSQPFTFVANGTCGNNITATFGLLDGTVFLGRVTYTFLLGTTITSTQTFSNATAIVIPGTGTGVTSGAPATPYPSTITVAGITDPVTKVTVTLKQITHTLPSDVDVLLVGPTGLKFVLMSDAIGGSDWTGQTYTFDDGAVGVLPSGGAPPASGSFNPTNYGTLDLFPAPAPASPYLDPATAGTDTLAAFNGLNPNGTWSLYVTDDTVNDIGTFAGGWDLTITSQQNICTAPSGAVTTAGQLIISEFRVRGPNGANDEFIDMYNTTGAPLTVQAADASAGLAVAASDGVARAVIPNGTVIPAGGHFLCTNSVGYSIAAYPFGTGDDTYTTDIPDNAGIALFNNSTGGASFSLLNRLDAVGSTTEANLVYKEGTGYTALTPFNIDYSFVRKWPDGCTGSSGGGNCTSVALMTTTPGPTSTQPQDTDNNAADFIFVDTNGTPGQRLGAPGPQNLAGPGVLDGAASLTLLDSCAADTAAPNFVRDFTMDPGNNSTFGTLDIRKTFTNNSGGSITGLRFRVIDISTFPSIAGVADLRPRTSTTTMVTVDQPPCGSGTSVVNVLGTTLEQPPSQLSGGGYNSSLSVGTVTLAAGSSIDVRLLLGVQQNGVARFCIIPETVPASASQVSCFIVADTSTVGSPVLVSGGATITSEGCSPSNGAIDPGETVTVSFCVTNTGGTATTNLVGTLQATGGVTSPSGPQTYGAVQPGPGPGSTVCRNFTFTAANQACGSTLTATIQFQDGATNLGTMTYMFTLGTAGVACCVPAAPCTTINCPGPITQSNDPNGCGAVVNYADPTTTGSCGTVICSPASGLFFPVGTTTVICKSNNGAGPEMCSFTVEVNDTQPPTLAACPSDTSVATGGACQVVNYTPPTATDNCPGPTVNCVPPSGFCFPVGTTTVTCTASDASPDSPNATCSFTVMVDACAITCPADIIVNNTPGQCGTAVTFAPAAPPACGTVTCTPASGTVFPVGATTVLCSTTVGPSCSFTVKVNDTQPPTITCPANITSTAAVTCPLSSSAPVNFTVTASDNCPGVTIVCKNQNNQVVTSGQGFPVGTTTVTCTATDASGNTAACSFTVTVFNACLQDDSDPSIVVLFNSQTGEYRFCCGGTVFTGTGTARGRGCLVAITHIAPDSRVQINFDGSVNKGSASLQAPGGIRCTIQDRDTDDNNCVCQ